ncbi:hypothetical protein RSAG8_07769, partial [Rhizoctonia solani AG-8 WAC10335]
MLFLNKGYLLARTVDDGIIRQSQMPTSGICILKCSGSSRSQFWYGCVRSHEIVP